MRIAIDLDCVLNNLIDVWIARYNQDHEKKLKLENITEWDLTKIADPDIYEYLMEPGFFIT